MKTETIIRENGYTAVWTKQLEDSKPWQQAITAPTLTELRQIAAEHGGEVHFLRRHAGERTFEDKGVLRASNLTQITYPENCMGLITTWEQSDIDVEQFLLKGFDNWGLYLAYHCTNADLSETMDVIKRLWVMEQEMLAFIDENLPTLIVVGEGVEFTTTTESVAYSFDIWEFQLGVIIQ